jgi:hypothetical protein
MSSKKDNTKDKLYDKEDDNQNEITEINDEIHTPKDKKVYHEHYIVHYPDHPPRKDSEFYKKTHINLCIKQNTPCFICGKTHRDGSQMESHHFFIEKAAESAVDWIKFGEYAQNFYNPQSGTNIGKNFDWKEVSKNPDIFVDSEDNMIVLCEEHHRSNYMGIHHMPFPEWILQLAPKDGFAFITKNQK